MQSHLQASAPYTEIIQKREADRVDELHIPAISYTRLFVLFLTIGATSWGGFMGMISVMQKQLAERHRVMKEEDMIRAISLASMLPGPMAVNVVAYAGYKLKGLKGALVSMAGVLLPCFALMLLLSYAYLSYGSKPLFTPFFLGIVPAVAAIIFNASITMRKKNITDYRQLVIAVLALLAVLLLHWACTTVFIIVISGFAGYLLFYKKASGLPGNRFALQVNRKWLTRYITGIVSVLITIVVIYSFSASNHSLLSLYSQIITVFSGLSLSQFGGGYVVIPTMQKTIADNLHWLSQKQFTDAIAMGQITPGPIYISAAFTGYKLLSIPGAVVATIAMFLPSALLMIVCSTGMNRVEKSPVAIAAFKGIGAAVTGMIAASGILLLYSAGAPWYWLLLLCSACFFLSYRFQLSPALLIPLAGITGLLIF